MGTPKKHKNKKGELILGKSPCGVHVGEGELGSQRAIEAEGELQQHHGRVEGFCDPLDAVTAFSIPPKSIGSFDSKRAKRHIAVGYSRLEIPWTQLTVKTCVRLVGGLSVTERHMSLFQDRLGTKRLGAF